MAHVVRLLPSIRNAHPSFRDLPGHDFEAGRGAAHVQTIAGWLHRLQQQ